MGLNSLLLILINDMRYYTDTIIPANWGQLLNKYLVESKKEQWILTLEGKYKYVNDELHKFKLWLPQNEEYNDIQANSIKMSNMNWIKYGTVYNIPMLHKIIDIKLHTYKFHSKGTTTFIIEEFDDGINDYYFESNEKIDNHSLQEDINSFLSTLK